MGYYKRDIKPYNENTVKDILLTLNNIDGVKVLDFKFGYGYENRIKIEVPNTDVDKWNYFCYKCTSKQTLKIHREKNTFAFVFDNNETKYKQLEVFLFNLEKKMYTIKKPPHSDMTIICKSTAKCNLNCAYCYDKPFRDAFGHLDGLSLDRIDHLMSMMLNYTEDVSFIFHGGETTILGIDYHKKVIEMITEKYPQIDVSFSIQSNGILLNEDWFAFADEYNCPIGSSYSALSWELRGNKNNDILETIIKSKKAKNSIGVIDVITNTNCEDIIKKYEFYKEKGIGVAFNEAFTSGNSLETNVGGFENANDTKKYLDSCKEYFRYWLYDKKAIEDRFASIHFESMLSLHHKMCYMGNCIKHYISINVNGDLYHCDRPYMEKYRIGNIDDFSSMEEIYETEKYRNFSEEVLAKKRNYCSKCEIETFCNSDCPLVDIDKHQTASIPDGNKCFIRKELYKNTFKLLQEVNSFEEINPVLQNFIINQNTFLPCELKEIVQKVKAMYNIEENNTNLFETLEYKVFSIINYKVNNPYKIEYNCKNRNYDDDALAKLKRVRKENLDKTLKNAFSVISDNLNEERKEK